MVDGTRVKELVNYPQTAENYPKVIEALKSRFGKKENSSTGVCSGADKNDCHEC